MASNEVFAQAAGNYNKSTELPHREYWEMYSVSQALGSLNGQSVVDFACGTGRYTRLAHDLGGTPVVGVDQSPEMLEIANDTEREESRGIQYVLRDASDMESIGSFDLALGIYFLHYAHSEANLHALCRGIANNLRPGGRFVGWQMAEDFSREAGYYERHGVHFLDVEDLAEGDEYYVQLRTEAVTMPPFGLYHWTSATYEKALREAGFTDVRWIPASLDPEQAGPFWDRLLTKPVCSTVEATLPE